MPRQDSVMLRLITPKIQTLIKTGPNGPYAFSDRTLEPSWKEWGVDLVIEATGVFIDKDGASKHIRLGAKKVLITAPGKGVPAIRQRLWSVSRRVITTNARFRPPAANASCTTNCLAPIVKVPWTQNFGSSKEDTTTHSYTGDQRILMASHRICAARLRRSHRAHFKLAPPRPWRGLSADGGKASTGIAMRVFRPELCGGTGGGSEPRQPAKEEVNEVLKNASKMNEKESSSTGDLPLVRSVTPVPG